MTQLSEHFRDPGLPSTPATLMANDAVEFNRKMSSGGWDLEFLSLESEPARLKVDVVNTPTLTIQKVQFSGRLRQMGAAPDGFLAVGVPSASQNRLKFGDRECCSKHLFSFNTAIGIDAVTERNYEAFALSVREERVEHAIESQKLLGATPVCLASRAVSKPAAEQQQALRAALSGAFEAARRPHSQNVSVIESEITSHMISAWFGSSLEERYQYKGSSRRLMRVIDYVRANLDAPLSVESICRECAIGRKTLERDFRSHFDVSPRRYINMMRLSAVKNDLLDASDHVNVQDVAANYGFHHLSKFAADYRLMFGELPSVTKTRTCESRKPFFR